MSLLANSRILIYNAKISFTNFGYTLYMITIPAYSFIVSGSILFTGITLFVEYGIYALTFLCGPIVDRVEDKRIIIIVSEAGIGFAALALGLLMKSSSFSMIYYLVLVGLIAVFWDFIWTADWAVLPLIVEPADLPRANGYSNAIGNGHVAAGLGVGGFLFVLIGSYFSMLLYSFCLFAATALTYFLPAVLPREGRVHGEGLVSGWKYIMGKNRSLLNLSIIIAFFSFFSVLPVLGITNIYASTSKFWYSFTFSFYYIGAVVSGIIFGKFFPRNNLGRALTMIYGLSGLLLVSSVALDFIPAMSAVSWFLLGFFFSAYVTIYGTYLQTVTDKEMLGRSASNLYIFRGFTSAAGTMALPFLIERMGILQTSIFSGVTMILAAVAVYAIIPSMRSIKLPDRITLE